MKVFVIGLDCAGPDLLFNKFLPELPNFQKIFSAGATGQLRSTLPPITIPAWMTMVTGKSPGELGVYGFRHLKPNTYDQIYLATSNSIKAPRVWDSLAIKKNKKSIVFGVPPSYPPYPINGYLIGCFLTPDSNSDYTFPVSLKNELNNIAPYIPDVAFRAEDKDLVLRGIFDMAKVKYEYIKYLLKNKEWDFFMFVDIGIDRVHHSFWRYFDETHHLYEDNAKYKNAIKEYYKFVDTQIGEIMKLLPQDTVILVVSDHGVKKMKGAFCINEWLYREGYLKLKYPDSVTKLYKTEIDWENTIAWGWGGYYARIFINQKGKFPSGNVDDSEYRDILNELKQKLTNLEGPDGNILKNQVYTPSEVYPITKGDTPDLMLFIDDLYYRAAGTVGHNRIFLEENDTGPDDAVHDWYGVIASNHKNLFEQKEKIENVKSIIEGLY